MWFFMGKGVWQRDISVPFRKVLLMEQLDSRKMALEGFGEGVWQHGHPVLRAFSIPHGNVVRAKIEVFHPELHTFHQT